VKAARKHDRTSPPDDRLPMRWAFILFVAVIVGIGASSVGGVVGGWGAALITITILQKVVGT
jgi:hypothetical protein